MNLVQEPEAKIAAVLHDVVEDTNTTLADLRKVGFSEQILDAISCLTHDPTESYEDYVVRCRANPIARTVKLADLQDNTRLDRTILRPERIQRDFARVHRYLLTYQFLTDKMEESEYRRLMKQHGDVESQP
jgi:(p)ppGpp synthase/HD superfamily hydrolase